MGSTLWKQISPLGIYSAVSYSISVEYGTVSPYIYLKALQITGEAEY